MFPRSTTASIIRSLSPQSFPPLAVTLEAPTPVPRSFRHKQAKPGVTECSAQVEASKLLSNPMVQDRIAQLNKERLYRVDITADRVLQEIALIGFQNMGNYCRLE